MIMDEIFSLKIDETESWSIYFYEAKQWPYRVVCNDFIRLDTLSFSGAIEYLLKVTDTVVVQKIKLIY